MDELEHQKTGEECTICRQNTILELPQAGYFQPFLFQAYLGQFYHDFVESPSKSWGFHSTLVMVNHLSNRIFTFYTIFLVQTETNLGNIYR